MFVKNMERMSIPFNTTIKISNKYSIYMYEYMLYGALYLLTPTLTLTMSVIIETLSYIYLYV